MSDFDKERSIEVRPGEHYDLQLNNGQRVRVCGWAFVTPMGIVYFPESNRFMRLEGFAAPFERVRGQQS